MLQRQYWSYTGSHRGDLTLDFFCRTPFITPVQAMRRMQLAARVGRAWRNSVGTSLRSRLRTPLNERGTGHVCLVSEFMSSLSVDTPGFHCIVDLREGYRGTAHLFSTVWGSVWSMRPLERLHLLSLHTGYERGLHVRSLHAIALVREMNAPCRTTASMTGMSTNGQRPWISCSGNAEVSREALLVVGRTASPR